MITAGVLGATGYMGGEVIRILLNHPEVNLVWATSRTAGRTPVPIENFHANFYGHGITLIHPDDTFKCDIVFLALPTVATLQVTPKLLALGCRVIDLGAAFRLQSQTDWERLYKKKHPQWSLVEQAVYGINELHLDDIEQANLIANPGCFSSAAILALAPLITENLIETKNIVVNGLSGTTGMGAELSRAAHHPEIGNNIVAYNVVDHRHSYEMEQELSALTENHENCKNSVSIHFTPTYVPITRGILNICHCFNTESVSRKMLLELYRDYYKSDPFVSAYDLPKDKESSWQYKPYPWVSSVAGTNNCYIGLDIDKRRDRIVVFSVLDSIGKGGAQVAIENMNLMFGIERTVGLHNIACHPN